MLTCSLWKAITYKKVWELLAYLSLGVAKHPNHKYTTVAHTKRYISYQ